MASRKGQAEIAVHFVGQIDDELAVVGGERQPVPGERSWGGAGDVDAVARVARAVTRTLESMGELERRSSNVRNGRVRKRFRANRAAQMCARCRDRVERLSLAEHEQPFVREE